MSGGVFHEHERRVAVHAPQKLAHHRRAALLSVLMTGAVVPAKGPAFKLGRAAAEQRCAVSTETHNQGVEAIFGGHVPPHARLVLVIAPHERGLCAPRPEAGASPRPTGLLRPKVRPSDTARRAARRPEHETQVHKQVPQDRVADERQLAPSQQL
eukprot:1973319-Prymnesium_polylepis.1